VAGQQHNHLLVLGSQVGASCCVKWPTNRAMHGLLNIMQWICAELSGPDSSKQGQMGTGHRTDQ
jgi:hypothetical protein